MALTREQLARRTAMEIPAGAYVNLGLGIPTLVLCNLVRIVSLIFIGHWFPRVFHTAHLLVWQSLIVFLTVMLWVLWALVVVGRDEPRPT